MGCCILVHALCKGLALFTKMPRAKESYPRDVSGESSLENDLGRRMGCCGGERAACCALLGICATLFF
uniref:Uncharacterized protein n=1 Tax=Physcomitrium patens TaxID=3218 RepID=A0A2K1J8I7_PHYPA|nr:hypothetical protein PHYPA_020945 [Physcomitrium patens]